MLEALSRRPTRPSLPVSGKSSTTDPSPGESEVEEMDLKSSLKRKQDGRKKGDPKKGKHK